MRLDLVLLCGVVLVPAVAAAQVGQGASAGVSGQSSAPGQAPAAIGQTPSALAPPSTPHDDSPAVAEVIVTANKRAESINTVPISITAATGDQLAKAGVSDVRDLVKVVPGFNYQASFLGAPIYSIRGIGFYETALAAKPAVAVYVDEQPLPFSVLTRGATLDLDRVEVLKGPQGILFGENSTGGAINYIAAKPTSTFQAGADVDYGRFNTVDVGGFISGPLSDTLGFRIAARTEQSGTYQNSTSQDLHLGEQNFTTFRALLDWRPTNKVKAEFNLNGFLDKSDNPAGQYIALAPFGNEALHVPQISNVPFSPRNDQAADWSPGQSLRRNNPFFQASGRIDYTVNELLTLTALASYDTYHQKSLIDPDGVALNVETQFSEAQVNSTNVEVRGAGVLFNRLHYVAGINYERSRALESDIAALDQSSAAYVISDAFHNLVPPFFDTKFESDQLFSSGAIFGNVDYDITHDITFHGGLRYTRTSIDFRGCVPNLPDGALGLEQAGFANAIRGRVGLTPISNPLVGECISLTPQYTFAEDRDTLDQDNVSWRTGIDWRVAHGVLLYGNVSKGYKAGGFSLIPATSAQQFVPAVQESVLAYEAGFKATLLDHRLQFNGAGFHYDYGNKQLEGDQVIPPFGPLGALVNVPQSTVNGAEVQLDWRPVRNLTLNGGATYVASRIGSFTNFTTFGQLENFKGESFPFTPKWQATAGGEYDLPLNIEWSGFFGANATYQGPTNAGLGDVPVYKIADYYLIDLRAGVQSSDGRYRLSVYGRNITNEYYWTNVVRALDTVARFAGYPATYGVSLSYRYR